jgi:hypothetical protein
VREAEGPSASIQSAESSASISNSDASDTQSTQSTSQASISRPPKRHGIIEHSKPKKKTLAQQWENVLDKAVGILDQDDRIPVSPPINSFATFISEEIGKLETNQQDEFKFGVMDLLRKIKNARKKK